MTNHQGELNIRLHPHSLHRVNSLEGTVLRALILALIFPFVGAAAAAKEKPPVQYQIPIPPLPDFSPLDWLQGQWRGKTLPNSPPGEMQLSVTSEMGKRFLEFRGEVSLAATKTIPATKESWMGILSPSTRGGGFIMQVFSSTGFITRYRLTMAGPEIRLNPEGGDAPPPGWLFRWAWSRIGPDEFTATLQVAPPGKAFFDYYSAKLARVPPAVRTSPTP